MIKKGTFIKHACCVQCIHTNREGEGGVTLGLLSFLFLVKRQWNLSQDIIINFPELRLNDLMSYNQLLVNLILVLLIKHRDRQTKKNPYGKTKQIIKLN